MDKIIKTDAQWRAQLTAMQYQVTRHAATEPPGTGIYTHHHEVGTYHCVCCGTALFASDSKFDSGCGWPSYFATLGPDLIEEKLDTQFGMRRIEVLCRRCDAHLGHVFPDGPPPTGLRYCINSAALRFEALTEPD